jgi:hypothetical protein
VAVADPRYARDHVSLPAPVRLVARLVGLRSSLDAAKAAEWASEIKRVENAVVTSLLAAGQAERRAAATEVKEAVARYRAYLAAEDKKLDVTRIAGAVISLTRISCDQLLDELEDFANRSDPVDFEAREWHQQLVARELALLRGIRVRWLAMLRLAAPERVQNGLWWRQLLPVAPDEYVEYLRELGAQDVAAGRVGDSLIFASRETFGSQSELSRLQRLLLRSPADAAAEVKEAAGREFRLFREIASSTRRRRHIDPRDGDEENSDRPDGDT